MIPGLGSPLLFGAALTKAYIASATAVDPWAELGSPARPLLVNIYVGAGVVLGASSPAVPGMLIRFYHGSVVNIYTAGTIGASGGKGGDGNRGRSDGSDGSSSFVGGGGGGGAGTNPGLKGNSANLTYEADDGSPGTGTTGGAGGVSNFGSYSGGSIPGGGLTIGSQADRVARTPALLVWPADGHTLTVNVWNSGSILAGGDGGIGGYQIGSLPGGANDGSPGEDLPTYYDPAPGALVDHPAIGYRSSQVTLNLKYGASYPLIRGRVVAFTSDPR